MEIYKLDIDTSKPTNQVLAMQQNSAGMLSIDVTNDGKYIRNLSVEVYDGGNEIEKSKYGYKVNVGTEPKHVKVSAKSVPYDSANTYVAVQGTGARLQTKWFDTLQIKPGVYSQDEFLPIMAKFPPADKWNGIQTDWVTHGLSSPVNFDRISIIPGNTRRPIWFAKDGKWLSPDEMISAGSEISVGANEMVKQGATLSSYLYPSIGYYTNYQVDTLIKPAQNTSPYATIEYDPSNIEAGNISADTFTLSGVTYVPTTLSVDGVAYSVLAAPIEQS